jgi:hypothetical protein
MRRRYLIPTALVAAAVLAVGPSTGASAKPKKAKQFSCTIDSIALGQPTPASPTVTQLGFVSCPKPLGDGLHYNQITITQFPAPGVPGAATGKFKNYFNRGTTRGTVAVAIVANGSPMNLTFTGTVTYTGGTGRFKHVAGGGTIVCTSTDGGAHKSCEVHTTLTGV